MKKFFRVDKGNLRLAKEAYDPKNQNYLAFASNDERIPIQNIVLAGLPHNIQLINLPGDGSTSPRRLDVSELNGYRRVLTGHYNDEDISFVIGKGVPDERDKSLIFPVLPFRRRENRKVYEAIHETCFYQASQDDNGVYYAKDLPIQAPTFPQEKEKELNPNDLSLLDEPFVLQDKREISTDEWKSFLESRVIQSSIGAKQQIIAVVGGMTYDPSTFYICAARLARQSKR